MYSYITHTHYPKYCKYCNLFVYCFWIIFKEGREGLKIKLEVRTHTHVSMYNVWCVEKWIIKINQTVSLQYILPLGFFFYMYGFNTEVHVVCCMPCLWENTQKQTSHHNSSVDFLWERICSKNSKGIFHCVDSVSKSCWDWILEKCFRN